MTTANNGSWRRRIAVTVGGMMVGAFALTAVGTPAMAADPTVGPGNIDTTQSTSLTIHKYYNQSGSATGNPTGNPDPSFTDPVKDVVFTVYPLLKDGQPLDLTVPANWDGLSSLTPGANCAAPTGFTLGTGIPMPATDASGVSTKALDQGLYQVCETSAPADVVTPAAPFILTLPLPYQNSWVYDVHAYPKNTKGALVKTIDTQNGLGLGSPVTFPVSTAIPSQSGGDLWTSFILSDTVDSRLTPTATTNGVKSVKVAGADLDSSYYTAAINGQTITMTFTAAGLAWLNGTPASGNAQAGQLIEVVFDTTVTALPSLGDGSIENTANLWINNPGMDSHVRPPLPSNEVTTNWGDVIISKIDKANPAKALSDAVFEVYESSDPYATNCSSTTATGSAISVNGATTFTTGVNGKVTIAGLFVSDSEHAPINATARCYVLKETVAPAGYVLPSDPYTAVSVITGQTATTGYDAQITNSQQTVPQLPLTGANGQLLLTLGGLGLLLLAGGTVLVSRRRAASQA